MKTEDMEEVMLSEYDANHSAASVSRLLFALFLSFLVSFVCVFMCSRSVVIISYLSMMNR